MTFNAGGNMADQDDVRRIALSLPQTVEAEDRFAFSVVHNGKQKGILWVWHERVEPKKPRVPVPTSSPYASRMEQRRRRSSPPIPRSSSPNRITTAFPLY